MLTIASAAGNQGPQPVHQLNRRQQVQRKQASNQLRRSFKRRSVQPDPGVVYQNVNGGNSPARLVTKGADRTRIFQVGRYDHGLGRLNLAGDRLQSVA